MCISRKQNYYYSDKLDTKYGITESLWNNVTGIKNDHWQLIFQTNPPTHKTWLRQVGGEQNLGKRIWLVTGRGVQVYAWCACTGHDYEIDFSHGHGLLIRQLNSLLKLIVSWNSTCTYPPYYLSWTTCYLFLHNGTCQWADLIHSHTRLIIRLQLNKAMDWNF